MIYSAKYIKPRYMVCILSVLFIYDIKSNVIILSCIVITLVWYQKYIMTLFHDGDVIYDININFRSKISISDQSYLKYSINTSNKLLK